MQTETDSSKLMSSAKPGYAPMDLELFNFGHAGSIYSCMQPDALSERSYMAVIDFGSHTVDVMTECRGISSSLFVPIISRIMEMERRGVRFLPKQVIKRALRKILKGTSRSESSASAFPSAEALHHAKVEVFR